ncbi:hypothetical protein DFJ74DRAFT_681915 [Hyaloraphidium curvatum]|nr:hypothetical protein DFJ74DRAFT_681915 [Hyaloraphidium curvatum]
MHGPGDPGGAGPDRPLCRPDPIPLPRRAEPGGRPPAAVPSRAAAMSERAPPPGPLGPFPPYSYYGTPGAVPSPGLADPYGGSPVGTPGTPDEDGSEKKRRRKERIKVACDSCNRSKHSCDGQRPCARCKRAEKTCTYERAQVTNALRSKAEPSGSPDLGSPSGSSVTFSPAINPPPPAPAGDASIVPYLNTKIAHLAGFINPRTVRVTPPHVPPTPAERAAVRSLAAQLLQIAPPGTKLLSELRTGEIISGDPAGFPAGFLSWPRDGKPATFKIDGADIDGFVVWHQPDGAVPEEYYAGCVWVLRSPPAQPVPAPSFAVPQHPLHHSPDFSSQPFPSPPITHSFSDSSMRAPSLYDGIGRQGVSPAAAPPSPDHAPELRKTFRLLVPVIDANDAAALIEDAFGRCVSANARFCSTFGILGPPESLVGQQDCSVRYVAPKTDDPAGFEAAQREATAAKNTASGDGYEFRLADGRIFQRDYVAVVSSTEPPEYAGHIWLFRDVTLQKAWEVARTSSGQHRPRSWSELTPEEQEAAQQTASLVEDDQRRVVLTNRAFTELFSVPVPPDALIGTDCSRSADQAKHLFMDPETFVARIEQILRERKVVRGELLQMRDGRMLERDYMPCWLESDYLGHAWTYRIKYL